MRKQSGQLGVALIILMILGVLIIGAISVDTYHMQTVRSELQNAVDAAALAGAHDLWFNVNAAAQDAYTVAAANHVDGVSVSNSSPRVHVTVNVTAPTATAPGTVEVIATKRMSHFLAGLFGRYGDTITARALAGTSGRLWRLAAGQAFPLAVSLDFVPQVKDARALNTCKLGDTFTIYFAAQGAKNVAYTSFTNPPANASYVKDAINDALGIKDQPDGFIPSIKLGDTINIMNGNLGNNVLTKDPGLTALQNSPALILPVIKGEPAFNKGAVVVGFIGFKVTPGSVVKNDQDPSYVGRITGTLINPQVEGETGPIPLTGVPIDDQAISRLELGPVQLLE